MQPPPSSRRRARAAGTSALALLPPAGAVLALAAFAAHQRDPLAAAETAYLALLAGALLAAVAAIEAGSEAAATWGRRGGVAAVAAVLAVLAAWTIPAGPAREAAVVAAAVAALAVAAGRRLAAPPAVGIATRPPAGWLGACGVLVPLAVAVQVLVRADRLLAPELGSRLLAGLLGLPLVAALAAGFLVARGGRAPALVATATAALAGPGFTTLTAGALVALAGAEAAWRPVEGHAAGERGAVRGGAMARGVGFVVTVAALVAVGLVEPWAAVVVALAAVALGGWTWSSGAVVLAATGLLAVSVRFGGLSGGSLAGWGGGGEVGAWSWQAAAWRAPQAGLVAASLLLAPLAVALAAAASTSATRRWVAAAVAALFLALVAVRGGLGLPLAAAPLAAVPLLAGQALRPWAPGARHALFAPQVVWSAALLAAATLAAAPPWLRARPLAAALDLAAAAGPWAPLVVSGLAALAAASALWATRRQARAAETAASAASVRGSGRFAVSPARAAVESPERVAGGSPAPAAAAAAALLLLAALVAALPWRASVVLLAETADLSSAHPRLEMVLPPELAASGAGREILAVADTSLSHAAAVPQGTPVARLRLAGWARGAADAGAPSAALLVAGRDTAEWAIRRPDVAAAAAHRAPEPWLARVTADGFFGLVFRSRRTLAATPAGASAESRRLIVERHPALPPEAIVHLHRLELRR